MNRSQTERLYKVLNTLFQPDPEQKFKFMGNNWVKCTAPIMEAITTMIDGTGKPIAVKHNRGDEDSRTCNVISIDIDGFGIITEGDSEPNLPTNGIYKEKHFPDSYRSLKDMPLSNLDYESISMLMASNEMNDWIVTPSKSRGVHMHKFNAEGWDRKFEQRIIRKDLIKIQKIFRENMGVLLIGDTFPSKGTGTGNTVMIPGGTEYNTEIMWRNGKSYNQEEFLKWAEAHAFLLGYDLNGNYKKELELPPCIYNMVRKPITHTGERDNMITHICGILAKIDGIENIEDIAVSICEDVILTDLEPNVPNEVIIRTKMQRFMQNRIQPKCSEFGEYWDPISRWPNPHENEALQEIARRSGAKSPENPTALQLSRNKEKVNIAPYGCDSEKCKKVLKYGIDDVRKKIELKKPNKEESEKIEQDLGYKIVDDRIHTWMMPKNHEQYTTTVGKLIDVGMTGTRRKPEDLVFVFDTGVHVVIPSWNDFPNIQNLYMMQTGNSPMAYMGKKEEVMAEFCSSGENTKFYRFNDQYSNLDLIEEAVRDIIFKNTTYYSMCNSRGIDKNRYYENALKHYGDSVTSESSEVCISMIYDDLPVGQQILVAAIDAQLIRNSINLGGKATSTKIRSSELRGYLESLGFEAKNTPRFNTRHKRRWYVLDTVLTHDSRWEFRSNPVQTMNVKDRKDAARESNVTELDLKKVDTKNNEAEERGM